MSIPPEVLALKPRFKNARREYATLKQDCEARVANWRWATWTMFTQTPYEFERSRSAPGRWLADEKKRKDGAHQYGFDDQGRVTVERELVIIPGWPEAFYEEFHVHDEGVIEGTRYGHWQPKEPINVSRTVLNDGRVISRASWAVAGCGLKQVCWRGDRPASVAIWNQEHESYHGGCRPALIQRFEFTHDEAGRLERIDLESGGETREVYRRARKGESIGELAAIVIERLVATVPAAVERAKIEEPAYALLLAYDWENPSQCLPPLLAIGLEPERRAFLEKHGRDADSYIWNPAELTNHDTDALSLDDKRLLSASELLGQELARRGKFATVEKVLLESARVLNERPWTELQRTEDFIVVPVDFETARVKRHLKALRSRGGSG